MLMKFWAVDFSKVFFSIFLFEIHFVCYHNPFSIPRVCRTRAQSPCAESRQNCQECYVPARGHQDAWTEIVNLRDSKVLIIKKNKIADLMNVFITDVLYANHNTEL